MARSNKSSFPRRKPGFKRGAGRPGIPYVPPTEPRPTPKSEEPLFAVFADGHRVYLPPSNRPGVPFDEAERLASVLPGGVVVPVSDLDSENG